MLDKLHEEIVDVNSRKVPIQANKMMNDNTTQDSAVWQIFGSTLKTELQKDQQKPEMKYEPTFQIMVDIQEDECTIEECLDSYFSQEIIETSN